MFETSSFNPNPFLFKAADYLRLSKEDGDFSFSPGKTESNSISSQRELILRFVEKHPEIELVEEYIDDGYTGTNFDRPRFQQLMGAVERGEINCIIVKDLSRFGREYIGAGQYIEKLFPRYGVRFIAINDGIDTGSETNGAESLMIPFKNLINDSYSRDISIKVRSSLEAKRRRGDFIACFAPYGYQRDPSDKSKMVIDPCAAGVVRDIFRWKVEGLSPDKIAARLNEHGVKSPAAYKSSCGSKYNTNFQRQSQTQWCAKSVTRILTNEVYCGTLIQGRRSTPNYKVKKEFTRKPEQWARIENSHEAIIPNKEFLVVQRLMSEDSRACGDADNVRPLAGRVFCGSCATKAKRKSVVREGKTYVYYTCPNAARGGTCERRTISEDELEAAVLLTLQTQIAMILDIRDRLSEADIRSWETREIRKLEAAVNAHGEQIRKYKDLLAGVYEDYRDGVIDQGEMAHLKEAFSKKITESEGRISALTQEIAEAEATLKNRDSWFSQFCVYQNIAELTRAVVVNLIDRILIYPEKRVQVILLFQDQINELFRYAEFVREREQVAVMYLPEPVREVV